MGMLKKNGSNFSVLLILVLAVSLGCSFLEESSTDNSNVPGNGESAGSAEKKLNTDDIEINFEDENPQSPESSNKSLEDENGNKTVQVKFAKGATSRSFSDSVVRATAHTYVLGAASGQTMSVGISSNENNAVFRIIAPGGKTLAGTEEEGITRFNRTLPASGEYKIIVTPTRGNATYKIDFAVSARQTEAEPEEPDEKVGGLTTVVRFPKGGTSASFENAVVRGERNTYILGAGGGQVMSVSIGSVENNAVFDILAPNGGTLAREKTSWSGRLPADGRYRIIVGGTRGNASYKINFAVR